MIPGPVAAGTKNNWWGGGGGANYEKLRGILGCMCDRIVFVCFLFLSTIKGIYF